MRAQEHPPIPTCASPCACMVMRLDLLCHGVQWLYNCWGIMTVINMDSLTGHNIVDTTDRETMMSDIADWHARTPMRTHTVGGNRHLMQMWETAEKFNCDTIIMYDDIGRRAGTA